MKNLFKLVAGALTALLSISSGLSPLPGVPVFAITPINNGVMFIDDEQSEIGSLQLFTEQQAENTDNPNTAQPNIDKQAEPLFISQNISAEREDLSLFTKKDGKAIQSTYKSKLGYIQLPGGGQVRNFTEIDDSVLQKEIRRSFEIKPENVGEPTVLIVHTHTSESFLTTNSDYYDTDYTFRTIDSTKNIVAVGAAIAEELANAGVGVIHDGTMHDYPNYTGAYKRSADTVKTILAEYPSIKVVLDIHRDAIETDGNPIAAVAEIGGKQAAQVMVIAPADDGNWGVPDFLENFRFASHLQSQLESDNPGLTRAILFQYCNYNMQLSSGALLVEIGSHGNTLEQALYTGELLGKSLGRLLTRE